MQVESLKDFFAIFRFYLIGSTSFIFQDILVSASAPINFSIQLQLNLNLYTVSIIFQIIIC